MPLAARLACAFLLVAAGCAAPNSELNVAPLFARHTLPGWEEAEALGGALRFERTADASSLTASPMLWRRTHADGRREADFLFALGRRFHDPARPITQTRLFPLGWYRSEGRADGIEDNDWGLLFWLIGGGTSQDGENYFWVFPFGGRGEDVLTYDEFEFVLWPFYLHNRKDERESTHLLWPIFGWQEGSEDGWRVFPFYGKTEVPGKYRRSFIAWPFVHLAENDLDQAEPRRGWLVLLLGGHIEQDDYEAFTLLWPFIGWARRPSTGYRSWAVWPLVKFEQGGSNSAREIARVLPFWQHYRDPDTEFATVLWPFFWWWRDRLQDAGERESWYGMPLFFASRSTWADGGSAERTRFWPFLSERRERNGAHTVRILDPGIPPVLDDEVASRNFGWLYEIWSAREAPPPAPLARSQRAWLGLYRAAEGSGHRRASLAGLGGRWTEPDGTAHTALLFGLLRWRRGPDGERDWEAPAFPGPGWPDLSASPPPSPRP
jgi:hypothetical protein